MYTPWGQSQTSVAVAKGIIAVSTASHGGYYLDSKRNAQVPEYMRCEEGWYEEDCDWAIVCLVFAEEFRAFARTPAWHIATSAAEHQRRAASTLRDWMPDMFEKFFNVILLPGESHTRDSFIFEMNHRDDFVGRTAYGDWHVSVPAGFVGVRAERKRPEAEGYFLVPVKEYRARGKFPLPINEESHKIWPNHP